MQRLSLFALLGTTAVALAFGAVGCGATPPLKPRPLKAWLASDAVTKSATVSALASYNDAYNGFNFNGYSKGAVLVTIPRGWKISVRCINRSSSLRHSCALVSNSLATIPAFPGASTPDPETGLAPGQAATFTLTASKPGVYRLACLVPEHERAGMWDALQITRSGRPSVQLLRP